MNDNSGIDVSFLEIQYQVLSNRQQIHNELVWNVPALLFTAESILWGISFGDVPDIICCCISFISVLVAFASWQQFERGRLMEIADSEQLYAIEQIIKEMSGPTINRPVMIAHHTLKRRTIFISGEEHNLKLHLDQETKFLYKNPLARLQTFAVWRIMFAVMLTFSIFLFAYSIYTKWPL